MLGIAHKGRAAVCTIIAVPSMVRGCVGRQQDRVQIPARTLYAEELLGRHCFTCLGDSGRGNVCVIKEPK